MYEYVFFVFSVITFFILVRESIIDIKTMYVPDNITFAIYTSSIVFLAVSWFATHSFLTIKDGIFGFLLGFGVPFAISFLSYISQLAVYKLQKRKGKDQEESSPAPSGKIIENQTDKEKNKIEESVTEDNGAPKKWFVKRILYWILCFGFLYFLSTIQTSLPQPVFLGIGIATLMAIIVYYEKTKKIEVPIYLAASGMLMVALLAKKNPVFILLTVGAVVIEWILARMFRKFYKIEVDEPTEETESEEEIEGGIGGGDILIFGALGFMFGVKGIITILLYALFSQLLIILSYVLLSKEKPTLGHAPFVPGITIGLYFYIIGFDLLNIQQILSFWGV